MVRTQCQYKSWDGSQACNEPVWQGSTEGFCIFHDPTKEKNINVFKRKLTKKLKQEDYNFRGYYFPRNIDFGDHLFSRDVDFEEAIFSSSVNFSNCTFSGRVNFGGTTFFERANFLNTIFTGGAYFAGATFFGGGNFVGSTFSGGAYFAGATFFGGAYFSGTNFAKGAHFARVSFSGGAYFSNAHFSNRAGFSRAAFSEEAEFMGADFSGDAHFLNAAFHKWARFEEAKFLDITDFVHAQFLGDTSFWKSTFGKSVDFQMATFAKNVSFLDTHFEGDINFENTLFEKNEGENSMSSGLLERSYRNVKNALTVRGDYRTAGEFYYREMEARRSQEKRWSNLRMTLYKWLCGYGEQPHRVILISLAVILLSALIFMFNGIVISTDMGTHMNERLIDYGLLSLNPSWDILTDYIDCLYYSAVTFIPVGHSAIVPAGYISRTVIIVEGFMGIFLILLFAIVTARKILR
ncbi:MAG: pentapeptide repeat-containing protein [Theionarchaea archaeon]|nr:pentapeptide repeat-containing protein [Theionarchaea archaeon]